MSVSFRAMRFLWLRLMTARPRFTIPERGGSEGLSSRTALYLVDISSSTNPVLAANWDPNDLNVMNIAYGVDVQGSYAYVAGGLGKLAVIDLAGLITPTAQIGNLLATEITSDNVIQLVKPGTTNQLPH